MNMKSFSLLRSRRRGVHSETRTDVKPSERDESRRGMETIYITTPMVLGWNPLLSTGVGKKKVG